MNADQREQVRSNAKYLREVRPVDPDEIHEYVEGDPHPAAVRQVLREEAIDLGLLEREDGTFEPVGEGPVSVAFHGVESFPDEYATRLEDELVERYGIDWADGESGDRLRERLRSVKTDYLYQNPVEYDVDTAAAYAVYHLPGYYAATQYVLADLAADGLLPSTLRVLDVGAGVGGPALGLHDLLPEDTLVDYHAVEPSAAADLLETMLAETRRNFHATVHRTTAEAFDPEAAIGSDGSFDLVLFANVWSELDDPAAVVRDLSAALADDGTVVGISPADRNTATNLRAVERELADDGPFTVYAPAVRLWPNVGPTDEGWSFDVQPDLEAPRFQRRLADGVDAGGDRRTGSGAGTDDVDAPRPEEFVNVDVQYAYTLLCTDGKRRIDLTLSTEQSARMADMGTHVTNRIDLVAIKLSRDLSADGNPLYRIGDGSQSVDHFAVLTGESALNRDLTAADYGDLLSFENVLVLWNDDEEAYNLVVDEETVVDAMPA